MLVIVLRVIIIGISLLLAAVTLAVTTMNTSSIASIIIAGSSIHSSSVTRSTSARCLSTRSNCKSCHSNSNSRNGSRSRRSSIVPRSRRNGTEEDYFCHTLVIVRVAMVFLASLVLLGMVLGYERGRDHRRTSRGRLRDMREGGTMAARVGIN